MNYISAKDFYNKTINKSFDLDKKYGVQCWDLFSYFTSNVYNKTFSCNKTGYVKDLWNYRKSNNIINYFKEVSINDIKDGDWVIWGNCKIAPNSHIAMYYNKKFLGQNQNNIQRTTLINITKTGVIGVLRPNIYINNKTKYKVGDKVNFKEIYVSSTATKTVKSLYNNGVITKILIDKPNPYLIGKNTGWLNDKKILNNNIIIALKKGTWNIRSGPGMNYKIKKVVKGGIKLKAFYIENNWYKVDNGYISKNAVIS